MYNGYIHIGLTGPRGRTGRPGINGTPGIPGINAWKVKVNGTFTSECLMAPSITGILSFRHLAMSENLFYMNFAAQIFSLGFTFNSCSSFFFLYENSCQISNQPNSCPRRSASSFEMRCNWNTTSKCGMAPGR